MWQLFSTRRSFISIYGGCFHKWCNLQHDALVCTRLILFLWVCLQDCNLAPLPTQDFSAEFSGFHTFLWPKISVHSRWYAILRNSACQMEILGCIHPTMEFAVDIFHSNTPTLMFFHLPLSESYQIMISANSRGRCSARIWISTMYRKSVTWNDSDLTQIWSLADSFYLEGKLLWIAVCVNEWNIWFTCRMNIDEEIMFQVYSLIPATLVKCNAILVFIKFGLCFWHITLILIL